uniref:Uncharacterized protein n=1 Tax=Heterorhabditis bacteriophora TaxID=37862 RepID=A0A1I7XCI7_HETBA
MRNRLFYYYSKKYSIGSIQSYFFRRNFIENRRWLHGTF